MSNNGRTIYNIDKIFSPSGLQIAGLGTPFGYVGQGNVYFVRPVNGNDGYNGKSPGKAFKTLAKALSVCRANQNDTVYLIAEGDSASLTTDYQSVALDWNKDLVHLIGVGATPFLGQRARIAQLSSVKTIEDLFTVSADNCIIANLGIYQGVASSTATSPRAMVVSGNHDLIMNCQISGTGDTSLDTAGARSLAITGAENLILNSYIGLDTVIRGTQTCEVDVANARNMLKDCVINSYTSLSTFKALTTTSSVTGRDVWLWNTHLQAAQNITSAVAPTGAIAHAQAGQVHLMGGSSVHGYANVCTADNTNVLVSGPIGGAVDMGLATGVDIA